MQRNQLGRTGLIVSGLGFGFGNLSGVDDFDRKVARCRDAGVTLFDTSDAYSEGRSEELLGAVLQPIRNDVLISTKAGLRVGPGDNDVGASRTHLIRACEDSLRRLRTDWIDLYQLHAPDMLTAPEETARAMEELLRSGKVRHVGCSNFSAWQVMRALETSRRERITGFSFQQIHLALTGRESERELVPLAIDQQMGLLIWGPLGSGFLSGKFKRGVAPVAGSRLASIPGLPVIPDWGRAFAILDVVEAIARDRDVLVPQVAINWLMRKPWVSSVLLGARTMEQLEDNIGAANWALSAEEVARLDAASDTPPIYPYWVHQFSCAERNPPLSGYRP
jgi:aryl-alcohol dehydrogenase-like predicted oxidoreductase